MTTSAAALAISSSAVSASGASRVSYPSADSHLPRISRIPLSSSTISTELKSRLPFTIAVGSAALPFGGSSSIEHFTDLSYELRGREWLLDERAATIDARPMGGGLFRVA